MFYIRHAWFFGFSIKEIPCLSDELPFCRLPKVPCVQARRFCMYFSKIYHLPLAVLKTPLHIPASVSTTSVEITRMILVMSASLLLTSRSSRFQFHLYFIKEKCLHLSLLFKLVAGLISLG